MGERDKRNPSHAASLPQMATGLSEIEVRCQKFGPALPLGGSGLGQDGGVEGGVQGLEGKGQALRP